MKTYIQKLLSYNTASPLK